MRAGAGPVLGVLVLCCACACTARERVGQATTPNVGHPLIATPSPDHYRYSPVHNHETWRYGTHARPHAGAVGWTYELRIWNSSARAVHVSGFGFSAKPYAGRIRGWQLVTGDTLWVNNTEGHSIGETIELRPEEYFRVSLNFGYDRNTPVGEYLATLRMECDVGGPFVVNVSALLVPEGQPADR